jgi:hypothetical protein
LNRSPLWRVSSERTHGRRCEFGPPGHQPLVRAGSSLIRLSECARCRDVPDELFGFAPRRELCGPSHHARLSTTCRVDRLGMQRPGVVHPNRCADDGSRALCGVPRRYFSSASSMASKLYSQRLGRATVGPQQSSVKVRLPIRGLRLHHRAVATANPSSSTTAALPHSWDLATWPPHVWPGSADRARYVVRMHRRELHAFGGLTRIGKTLVFLGAGYAKWLRSNAPRVVAYDVPMGRQ